MNWGGFDPQPHLDGEIVSLRPLAAEDRAGLYVAASDPLIWAQHPDKRRAERAVFDPYFDFLLARGTALCARARATGEIIGTSSFYLTPEEPPAASVGFTFLARSLWGGAANRDMKTLMLTHLFMTFDTAWLHIAQGNIRSLKATEKLGAIRVEDRTLDLGAGPALMATYQLPRATWQAHSAP